MRIVFTALFFLFSLHTIGQYTTKKKSAIAKFEEGKKAYQMMNFNGAISSLKLALEKDPEFLEPHLLLGDIYMETQNFRTALEHYAIVLQSNPEFKPLLFLKTASVELKLGEYSSGKKHLLQFKEVMGGVPEPLQEKYNLAFSVAEFGEKAIQNPVPFNPKNLGAGVNTQYDDYHPSVTVDGGQLVFTRKDPVARSRSGKILFKEDLYFSIKHSNMWGRAFNYRAPVNSPMNNEGSSCISHDGRYLFFTACNLPGGEGSCDIYVSERRGKNWSQPVNMGTRINTGSWESHPSLAPDGKTLYFTSNRPGGKGGADIWKSTIGEDGKWGLPENLSINTSGSDMTPSIHGDAYTMYFASNGRPGMGGHDIYICRFNPDGSLSEPKNLGYPINTPEEEFGMIADPKGRVAYYASEMKGGIGGLDIYQFELPENARPVMTQSMVGVVFHRDTQEKLEADVELIDLATGKVVARTISDGVTGEFLAALASERDYALNVSKKGFLFYSENFSLKGKSAESVKLQVPLAPIKSGEAVVLRNVFFETSKFDLKPESKIELNKLVAMLKADGSLRIEIGGHTDSRGDADKNVQLSENRAKSVKQFLIEQGIAENRLVAKGYGAKKPIADNNTEEGRAKNRRTEFRVL